MPPTVPSAASPRTTKTRPCHGNGSSPGAGLVISIPSHAPRQAASKLMIVATGKDRDRPSTERKCARILGIFVPLTGKQGRIFEGFRPERFARRVSDL